MQILLLGQLSWVSSSGERTLASRAQRLVLTTLALRAPHPVSADELIDVLWLEEPPRTAGKTLQAHLSRLRRELGAGVVETLPVGYRLGLPPKSVDAHVFRAEALAGSQALRRGDHAAAGQALERALRLWRGEPEQIEGLAGEQAHLHELRLSAEDDSLEVRVVSGDRSVADLELAVSREPLRERRWELLARALYADGRQGEALAVYQRARSVLMRELGVEPGPRLRRLERDVLLQDPSLERPRPSLGRLPEALTAFHGRTGELADCQRLLREHRLLTITGPAGVGKTRLAIELVRGAAPAHEDGVSVTELAGLTEDSLVPHALLASLGLPAVEDARSAVIEHLRGASALLLLDNAEHLRPAVTRLVVDLLRACPHVRVVVTSREPLGSFGESCWPLGPLAVPPLATSSRGEEVTRYDAVRLFVARAEAAFPDFALDDASAEDVMGICRAVDGLPLAVELAAAQLYALPLTELRLQLEEGLDPLALDDVSVPERHRSLRAAIGWSYDLLDEPERRAFSRLGVLLGPYDGAGATHVIGPDGPALLARLVRRGLVSRTAGQSHRMLASLRAFAMEKLRASDDLESARDGQLAWVAELATSGPPEDPARMRAFSERQDDVLAALSYALTTPGRAARGLDIAASLIDLWIRFGLQSVGLRLTVALTEAADEAPRAARAGALLSAGLLAAYTDSSELDLLVDTCHRVAGDDAEAQNLARLLTAWAAVRAGQDAGELLAGVVVPTPGGAADLVFGLSHIWQAANSGDVTGYAALTRAAHEHVLAMSDPHIEMAMLMLSIDGRLAVGETAASVLPELEDCLRLAERLNCASCEGAARVALAYVEPERAHEHALRAARAAASVREVRNVVFAAEALAAGVVLERPRLAARLLGGANALRARANLGLRMPGRASAEAATGAALQSTLGPALHGELAAGEVTTLDALVALMERASDDESGSIRATG